MKLYLCVIITLIIAVKGQSDEKYVVATGRYIRTRDGLCGTAAWYKNKDTKTLKITKGPHQILIKTDTQTGFTDVTAKNVTCGKDSDVTFDAFQAKLTTARKPQKLGTVKFSLPFTGDYVPYLTTLPVIKKIEKRTVFSWYKKENGAEKWIGADWISSKKGYSRVWWDNSFQTTNAPEAGSLEMKDCNKDLASDFTLPSPNGGCNNILGSSVAKYNMDAKPYTGSGNIHKVDPDDDTKQFSVPVQLDIDPSKKLYSLVSGDPSKQTDFKKFSIGIWSNATGSYFMFARDNKCTWSPGWTYDNMTSAYSAEQTAWIGKGTLQDWYPTTANNLEVNLYEGLVNVGNGVEIMLLVDNNGLYRGEIFSNDVLKFPNRVFMEKVESKARNASNFLPYEKCAGFKFFTGETDSSTDNTSKAGLNLMSAGYHTIFIVLCMCGLILSY